MINIRTILSIIFLISIFIGIFFCLFNTLQYYDLKSVISKCNKDFGIGNWTFTETTEYYSCKAYNQQNYITTSSISSRDCYLNGIKTKCDDVK